MTHFLHSFGVFTVTCRENRENRENPHALRYPRGFHVVSPVYTYLAGGVVLTKPSVETSPKPSFYDPTEPINYPLPQSQNMIH
jgi:hypothetical protein